MIRKNKDLIPTFGNDFLTFDFVKYYLKENDMHLDQLIQLGVHPCYLVFGNKYFHGLDFIDKFRQIRAISYNENLNQRFTFKQVAEVFDVKLTEVMHQITLNSLKGKHTNFGGEVYYQDILKFVKNNQIEATQKKEVIKELTENEKFMQAKFKEAEKLKEQRAAEQEKKRIESHRKHKINFIPRKKQQDLAN